jgi:ABC-type Na+ efflux pump permease subunit
MMAEIRAMLAKEWHCFLGSEGGMLAVYAVVTILWSALYVGSGVGSSPAVSAIWLLPFAVIAVSNFAQSVFVAERVNGSIEILLTCGLSRSAIVVGKMLFVGALGLAMGLTCIGLGALWVALLEGNGLVVPSGMPQAGDVVLYAAAVALDMALAALLSMLMPNPRISHFASFLLTAGILAAYYPLSSASEHSTWWLAAALAAAAVACGAAAIGVAQTERISRPADV